MLFLLKLAHGETKMKDFDDSRIDDRKWFVMKHTNTRIVDSIRIEAM